METNFGSLEHAERSDSSNRPRYDVQRLCMERLPLHSRLQLSRHIKRRLSDEFALRLRPESRTCGKSYYELHGLSA